MKYLYMDNFRGFQDTLLPLKDVNFFVGENSSGKKHRRLLCDDNIINICK